MLWSMTCIKETSLNEQLRGLDGRGHFYTIFVSWRTRALYKDMGKRSDFEVKISEKFPCLMTVYG